MPDFSNLKKLDVDGSTAREYKFDQIEGAPSIWSLPASEENKPYMNEALRRVGKGSRGGRRAKRTTVDTVKASRDEDKELFAKYCAKRWNVKDASGLEVQFTPENCREFLEALPDWIFDDYRQWLNEATNFLDESLGEI